MSRSPSIGLGEIIAERVLFLNGEPSVVVRLGRPRDYGDNPDSQCPYQIEGIGSGRVRAVYGVDAFQALELAMQTIGSDLYASQEYREGRLKAFSADNWSRNLGFPVPDIIRDLLPGGDE